jgi:acetyl esterase/lipase
MKLRIAGSILFCLATTIATAEKLPEGGDRSYPPELPNAEAETYKSVAGADLKLYVHKPKDWQTGDTRPAILFFFGGGWKSGSPSQFRYQCEYLAARGMVAITADYRVASRHQVLAIECVRDAVAAMRYVRANAGRLGIDPNKIVASGGSAGGHLAACLGTIEGLTDGVGTNDAVSYRPNAMVLFNPALHFGPSPGLAIGSERTGVDPLTISPFHHVKAGTPPTLLLYGTADGMFDAAKAFTVAMTEAFNRCELDAYEGESHGFFNVGRGENVAFRKTLESTDRFLASLQLLEGPPRVAEIYPSSD